MVIREGQKPRIAVSGDAQAQGVALVLKHLEPIAPAYEIVYHAAAPSSRPDVRKGQLSGCAFFLEQFKSKGNDTGRLSRDCKRITFPQLRFGLLWPLACSNPYNRVDAENPIGPFPVGNSFILSSVEQGAPRDEIMRRLLAADWNESWPNLDLLFRAETSALLAADAKCEVKIGSFVLKHFRKRRLFWAPSAPANTLLCELTYRLLHACFGRETPVERDAIDAALARLSTRDVMAHVAIPVHPLVAGHFGLEWYDREERYPYVKGSRSFEEYYRSMIDYIESQRAHGIRSLASGRS